MRLDHAGIYVDDLTDAERFLGEVLGLPLVRHSTPRDRNQAAFYSAGNAEIEAVWFPDPDERRRRFGDPGRGTVPSHVALGVDDLDRAIAALRGRGVGFRHAPTTSPSRTMQMTDPDTTGGIAYQLIQWYPPAPDADMPRVDAPPRAPGVGVTALDHVAAVVADFEASKQLLAQQFGLPLTDEDAVPERGLRFAYLAFANAQIELIAFDDPDRRDATLGGAAARLDHIALRVDDIAESGRRLQGRGVAFATPEPGRFRDLLTWNTQPETSMGVRFQLIQRGAG